MAHFHDYVKDGIYQVGEHGISLWDQDELPELIKLGNVENEDEDEELGYGYDTGEGAIILVLRLDDPKEVELVDYLYKVIVLENGDTNTITIEMDWAQELDHTKLIHRENYYSTDHALFGSGNTKPLYYVKNIPEDYYDYPGKDKG